MDLNLNEREVQRAVIEAAAAKIADHFRYSSDRTSMLAAAIATHLATQATEKLTLDGWRARIGAEVEKAVRAYQPVAQKYAAAITAEAEQVYRDNKARLLDLLSRATTTAVERAVAGLLHRRVNRIAKAMSAAITHELQADVDLDNETNKLEG